MEVRAVCKGVRISPRKVWPVLNLVRGLKVDEALNQLHFNPTRAAFMVSKVIRSASANAEHNHGLSRANLRILKAYAGDGPRLKRWRPKARGRVSPYVRRSCHITVVVGE